MSEPRPRGWRRGEPYGDDLCNELLAALGSTDYDLSVTQLRWKLRLRESRTEDVRRKLRGLVADGKVAVSRRGASAFYRIPDE